jgi:hypothetical protein
MGLHVSTFLSILEDLCQGLPLDVGKCDNSNIGHTNYASADCDFLKLFFYYFKIIKKEPDKQADVWIPTVFDAGDRVRPIFK